MLVPLPAAPDPESEQGRLLSAFTHLKDVQLRQKWEHASGIYLAESHNVIERAVQVGHVPEAFLLSPTWLEKLRPLLVRLTGDSDGGNIPVFLVEEAETERITGYRVHRGALAAFHRPEPADPSELLRSLTRAPGMRRVAVLEGLVDHTNVGAIFRSAAALKIDAILLSPTCADPLYRRSIRVSMGAVFQIPWARLSPWPGLELLRDLGFTTCALTPAGDAVPIDDFMSAAIGDLALYLGSEGPGLTRGVIDGADARVRIPLADDIDSLNVATAAAIAFWETRRR